MSQSSDGGLFHTVGPETEIARPKKLRPRPDCDRARKTKNLGFQVKFFRF